MYGSCVIIQLNIVRAFTHFSAIDIVYYV